MKILKRMAWLGLVLAGVVPAWAGGQPNVLLFLMDDMGYGDCRVYNPDGKIGMPNLERLAREGMVFTDAHSPSAVCAPTRYSLLTGNYPWRGRAENGTWGFSNPSQILPGQETLGHLLKRAGYRTAFFGKVHLGGQVYSKSTGKPVTGWKPDFSDIDFSRPIEHGPNGQGFDYSYTLPNGIQGEPYAFFENDRLVGDPDALVMWEEGTYGNSQVERAGVGSPDWDSSAVGPILAEKALAFLDRHLDGNKGGRKPFYMHFCSTSCHTPHSPSAGLGGKPVKGASGIDPKLDMLYEADVALGLLVEKLRAAGELDNTLVLFMSDNGGLLWDKARDHGHDSCAPLRGAKAVIWEGGHRVPLVAQWTDGIPPGTRSDALVGLQDIYATLAELVGQRLAPAQGVDSQSFLPVLAGKTKTSPRNTLFAQANDEKREGQRLMKMVRSGPWKLIATRDRQPVELYNLETDLAEANNLINHPEQRERIKAMQAELNRILDSQRSTPMPEVR